MKWTAAMIAPHTAAPTAAPMRPPGSASTSDATA